MSEKFVPTSQSEEATGINNIELVGNLETIEHLAQIGQLLVKQGNIEFIPTILEVIHEHSQSLTFKYAVEKE